QLDPGTEVHAVGLVLARRHHDQLVEAPGELLDAAVDLAQPLLAVDVLGVLGAVAVGGGLRDLARDARSLLAPQPLELGAQPLVAFGRDVAAACGHAPTMTLRTRRVNAMRRRPRRAGGRPRGAAA